MAGRVFSLRTLKAFAAIGAAGIFAPKYGFAD
jgi:hypothetical protein